jgi:hypothetical protein
MTSVLRHWVAWGTGSALVLVLWVLDSVYHLKIPHWVLIGFLVVGIFVSSFQSWQDQYRENETGRLAGSLSFTSIDNFWLDIGGQFVFQAGIVLSNIRDSLIEFRVDKLDLSLEGIAPETVPEVRLGGYCYPRKDTTFRAPGIKVTDPSKRPLKDDYII